MGAWAVRPPLHRIVVILAFVAALQWPPAVLADASQNGGSFAILDVVALPGERRRATWQVSESFAGVVLATPVFVLRGTAPGPTLCITAGIHGDELNGVEVVRRTLASVEPDRMAGTLIGVPIVNLHGFRRSSRYLPDRRDLNRYFPGRRGGSSASRIAFSFFQEVVRRCEFLVDLHTGSFHRENLPHVRSNLDIPRTYDLARNFGTTIIVHSVGTEGTLRRAATEAGIPAITYEADEPMRFSLDYVERGVEGIRNVMLGLGMLSVRRLSFSANPEVFSRSRWVRCDDGGILIADVGLGQQVEEGELLGTVTDPLSNERSELRAPHPGTVIGMALNQVVMPGFAAFHLGIREGLHVVLPNADEDWAVEAVEETVREGEEVPEE